MMTTKEKLIQEIERSPDLVVEELFDFLLLARIKHHRQQETRKPFWMFIEELISDIPQDVLDTMTTDGAEQHDHYLYGSSKRSSES